LIITVIKPTENVCEERDTTKDWGFLSKCGRKEGRSHRLDTKNNIRLTAASPITDLENTEAVSRLVSGKVSK
jgi:hypothetical protein